MQIVNCGRGVHSREVVGIQSLQTLPSAWVAFTNLDFTLSPGRSREIDVIMVIDDRIFLIDLKDWSGQIESSEGRWLHNGRDTGPSPVQKINQNAKEIAQLLAPFLKKGPQLQGMDIPRVQAMVVITGSANFSRVSPGERQSVMQIEEFMRVIRDPGSRVRTFGRVSRSFVTTPLTSNTWKPRLLSFFNVRTGPFKPGQRLYGGYHATSDAAVFSHAKGIFSEYEASDPKSLQSLGTLRLWDFTKADARFQSPEGRAEISGREREIIGYLNDRSEACEGAILQHKAEDPERGVNYWEVFDRKRHLRRLSEFGKNEGDVGRNERIEFARQAIAKVAAIHSVDASHLDLGEHSVWWQLPSMVKLSHFMAASIPQVQTLGSNRYQFLSTTVLPEDVLGENSAPQQRDVFQLGCVVHKILFDSLPRSENSEMPPEWCADIDRESAFVALHSWFESALALVPEARFENACVALDKFNAALATNDSARNVLRGLDQFRGEIKSTLQVFQKYPPAKVLKDDDRCFVWRSAIEGRQVLVKLWKRSAWGDQAREGSRILDFLNRARDLKLLETNLCSLVLEILWLGDAIVVVQEWVEGLSLFEVLSSESEIWGRQPSVLKLCHALTHNVIAFHDSGFAHGDLKPSNIVVNGELELRPILVDVLDFASLADGELISSAYAPSIGGRFERDRFAVCKIVEECLSKTPMTAEITSDISRALDICRTGVPQNGSLLPLLDALARSLKNPVPDESLKLSFAIVQSKVGPLRSDEGRYYLRRDRWRQVLFFRGACEELEIEFDAAGKPLRGHRRDVTQGYIAARSKYEFMSLRGSAVVSSSAYNDFSCLDQILTSAEFTRGWGAVGLGARVEEEASSADEEVRIDLEDDLAEAISAVRDAPADLDVRRLWRKLIDIESELSTEGIATDEGSYRQDSKRYLIPFELMSGGFDFDRGDRVLVEKSDKNGRWKRVGYLDIMRSSPELLAVEPLMVPGRGRSRFVEDQQRLRFISHYEKTSLTRRESAVTRILGGQSRIGDLIDIFEGRSSRMPTEIAERADESGLIERYGLNDEQAKALRQILSVRPVGLLQGPPGTGKTVFIAALVHHALTSGMVRNVLLASQSHEAVNNAAESLLKLFGKDKLQPSMIRVGHEGSVSERLLPFHTSKVEQGYKDRFDAEFSDRYRMAGRVLGLTNSLIEDLLKVETSVRPIARKLEWLEECGETHRAQGVRSSLLALIRKLGVDEQLLDFEKGERLVDSIVASVAARGVNRCSADKVAKMLSVSRICRDFVGSVSTGTRTFEVFLAGTRQVVVGTCVGLGRSSLGLTATPFDLVVVDEAARCTAGELAVPMQAGRWIVLVGDQAQLEPHHKADVISRVSADVSVDLREVVRSDFERVFESKYGAAAGARLATQYRMLPPIGRLVSSSFYGGRLRHGRTGAVLEVSSLPDDLSVPLAWLDTCSSGEAAYERIEAGRTSYTNPLEADEIVGLLRSWSQNSLWVEALAAEAGYPHKIGIICTYAAQRELVHRKIQAANIDVRLSGSVKIDTVDSYQGKENPVVILSLVRNNDRGVVENGIRTIRDGFLRNPNRLNVALSRAMDRLVVVGARGGWRSGSPMASVVAAFEQELAGGNAKELASKYVGGLRGGGR